MHTPTHWQVLGFDWANTPKAFANVSPGFEAKRRTLGYDLRSDGTLKGFGGWRTLSGLRRILAIDTQGCRCAPTAGLKLANAFGVIQTETLVSDGVDKAARATVEYAEGVR